MEKNKKLLTEQELSVMHRELSRISSAKEARAWHKKYKKYGHSIPFLDRYPKSLPILFYTLWSIGIIISIIAITVIVRLLK